MEYSVKFSGKRGLRYADITTRTSGYKQTVATITERDGHVTVRTAEDGRTVSREGTFEEAVGAFMGQLAGVI